MKKIVKKLTAVFLAFAMTVSPYSTAFAAPGNSGNQTANTEEMILSESAESILEAARMIASLNESYGSKEEEQDSKEKVAVRDAIFNGFNGTTDLSRFGISADKMDSLIAEILGENNMTDAVAVDYNTDDEDNVTTTEVEMDPMLTLAAEELSENATVYGLTEEQSQELLGMYAQYLQLYEANADVFGVQVPYNTTRDTNANPIGSLLDVAGVPAEYAMAGGVGYDVLSGIIQLYILGTQFAVDEEHGFKDEIKAARDEALSVLTDDMTEMQKYLALNSWLADNCQFNMAYIMEQMVEPEPAENQLYSYAYQCMYQMIYNQVYDGTYNALVDVYGEEQAKQIATAQADAFMVDVQEEGGSGEQQAASTASAIVGMWGSNQVGVFVQKKAVCFGYATVYAYLLQCAHPEIYLKDGKDLDTASNWKSYKVLNYELDSNGDPVQDENGDYKWSTKAAAIADYVKIIFDADVTMFGQDSDFGEAHYWNAVKLDGKWYYVDPCYVDIYVECMNRDRVETDGNLNHLYFMFSDDSCREMYEDNFKEIRTLYENIATDQTYEESWVAFVKSQPYFVGDKIYYFYDSTDLLDIMRNYGTGGNSNSRAANDYDGLFTETEYKIVYHDNSSMKDTGDEFSTLIDFNNGQVYNPETKEMEDNALIAELYEEHQEYVQEYPSISISCAYDNGVIYFSLSNCVLSYDLAKGTVTKLIEYTEVSGKRDMTNGLGGLAFTESSNPGENGITVKNPPIADMTIKRDGKMYVSIATNYAFISGKKFGELTDYSSYGYKFAETNYNPSYNTYYNNDEANDNDEFMWSANIVETIEMSHLAGSSHSYKEITVPASCTENKYTVSVCSTCGKIKEGTSTQVSVQTLNAGDGEDAEEGKAKLKIAITVNPDKEDKQEISGVAVVDQPEVEEGQELETRYTFTAEKITEEAEKILTDNNITATLDTSDIPATGVTVEYGKVGNVELIATKEAEKATATLNITVKAGEEVVATETMESEEPGPVGTDYTFDKAAIQEKVESLTLADGYVLADNTYEDVIVKYGETGNADFAAEAKEPEVEQKAATLNITVKAGEEVVATETMESEEPGPVGTDYTFDKAAIQEKVESLTLADGYVLADNTYEDVIVKYGETGNADFAASRKQATAILTIEIKDSTDETAAALKTDSLTAEGNEGEPHTFAKEDIQSKADEMAKELNSYTLDAYEFASVDVEYGKTETLTLTATPKEKADASLIVKVYNTPTVPADPEEDEEEDRTGLIVEVTDTTEGNVGETKTYTATDIENLVKSEVEAKGYKLDTVEEGAEVAYGETVVVKLTATAGAGHTYVKFNETYYTKSGGNWQTGTSYVCIDCGHAFELDEDGETVEENLRSNDKLLTDDEVAAYAKNTTEIWTWSTDGTEASMYTVPTELKDHMFDCVWENSAFSSREVATVTGDCETGKFTAKLASGKTATKDVGAGHHSYLNQEEKDDAGNVTQKAAVQWTWADDFSSAKASFICDVCGKTKSETVSGDAIEKSTTDPTCSEAGSNTYKATVTVDGVNYISSRSEEIPATGKHNFEDGVCTVCGEKENPFVDVSEEDYYYDAVLWAVHNGITVGKDETHFEPKANCTRAQVVTFLWRTMGEPKPETTENPFVDVAADAYYHDAVLWAYENGITVGIDSTHFAPGDTVTRCQFVAFLHRNEGEPKPETTENPFVDVAESKYYYNAVLWAYENGITVGKDETHFAPDKTCTRAEVVAFLYRTYGEEE